MRISIVLICLAIMSCGDDERIGPGDGSGGDATTATATEVATPDTSEPADTEPAETTAASETVEDTTSVTETVEDTFVEPEIILPCEGLCAVDELCGAGGTCYCTPGVTRACDIKIGDCKDGRRLCDEGRWTDCRPVPKDEPETCDGHDNNCDGVTDEGAICVPPTVACPEPRVVDLGERIDLLATASDPDGGDLAFEWTLLDTPVGAGVGLEPPDETETELAPDASGVWHIELCVSDDEGVEACCETHVDVRPPCVQPVAPRIEACGMSWDRRPIVQFPPLPANRIYRIEADGQALADVTVTGQNYFRPATALGVGGPPPLGAVMALGVRECSSATCCSEPATTTVALVESCTTPIAPTPENLIISEYLINGDGEPGCPGESCEAGEAIELTNLSHCPVALANHHLRYCNNSDCSSAIRFDDFGPGDVVPPRGVFVRIRNPSASTCDFDFLPPADDDAIFGLRRSTLDLEVDGNFNNNSGWFNNGSAGSLRVATGAYASPTSGSTILLVTGYVVNQVDCESVGFDALGACGDISAGVVPTDELRDNQLGRLWHPCDAVVNAFPTTCFD